MCSKLDQLISSQFLTENSQKKINLLCSSINFDTDSKSNILLKILDNFFQTIKKEIRLSIDKKPELTKMQNLFISFDKEINNVATSQFQTDVLDMTETLSVILKVNNDHIRVRFLFGDFEIEKHYIINILQAINCFCTTYSSNYDHLTINIVLDNNLRNIDGIDINDKKHLDVFFSKAAEKSGAFCVSGLTNRSKEIIILTKKQEIIKLLFHELVHYVGFDYVLISMPNYYSWSINDHSLNLSEAYTEFLAIIFNVAYNTIILQMVEDWGGKQMQDSYYKLLQAETEYSIYLSSNLFKLYGYNYENINQFFDGTGPEIYAPIPVIEYIVLRTSLLTNIYSVLNLITDNPDLRLDTKSKLLDLTKPNNYFLSKLKFYLKNYPLSNDFSYVLIDLDWNAVGLAVEDTNLSSEN